MNLNYFRAFISTGFNVLISFDPTPGFNPANRQCDFEKEPGKVMKANPDCSVKKLLDLFNSKNFHVHLAKIFKYLGYTCYKGK